MGSPLKLFVLAAWVTAHSSPVDAAPSLPPAPGSKYVAMGSSFAAGPAIGTPEPGSGRCGRSSENYAQLLAKARKLALVDVSCSGATTFHILGAWKELPPQINAVDRDTRLVSITIGGNDVNYVGLLGAYACHAIAMRPDGIRIRACPTATLPNKQSYGVLAANLREITSIVKRKAPDALLVFVQYPPILPDRGTCLATSLDATQTKQIRTIARRLAKTTIQVAHETGARVMHADRLLAGHDLCSAEPWINGYKPLIHNDGISFHPTHASMTAQAIALERMIWTDMAGKRPQ